MRDPDQFAFIEHWPVQQQFPLVAQREQVAQVLLLQAVRLRPRLIALRPLPQQHQRVPPAVGDGLLDLSIERVGHAPILSGRPVRVTHPGARRRP